MNFKKPLIWFYLLSKRLLFKVSFVLLLLSIPFLMYSVNLAMQGESGVLKIILCADEENIGAEEVINSIISDKSIVLFEENSNLDASLSLLEQKKADAVWYFADNFDTKLNHYASGKSSKPFVTVYEREDTVPLKLSREKLFGKVYNKFSYYVYRDFIYSEIADSDKVSEVTVKKYYDQTLRKNNIVQIKTIDGTEVSESASYLSSPLRGMLASLIVLCGLAGAMYFLKDKKAGRYDWLTSTKRIIPAFAECASAVVLSSLAVFISLFVSKIATDFASEALCMVLFTVATIGFCLCFAIIFRTPGVLGASIPAFIIIMMVLSPVFFNIQVLKPVRMMLPTHYYLYSIYDAKVIIDFVFYIICVYTVAFLLNRIINK